MKTNETNTSTARKLTLEEIEALPKTSVIWMSWIMETDEGIVWHEVVPVMVAVPGKDGLLIGGDKNDSWDRDIGEELFSDPNNAYWDSEPDRTQLRGISRNEYDSVPDSVEAIRFPYLVFLITYNGTTFPQFCDLAGLKFFEFWNALIGKREFVQWEISAIRNALELTDDQTKEIFFPEVAQI